eukprot:5435718-Prymnesium_polylepis.1
MSAGTVGSVRTGRVEPWLRLSGLSQLCYRRCQALSGAALCQGHCHMTATAAVRLLESGCCHGL